MTRKSYYEHQYSEEFAIASLRLKRKGFQMTFNVVTKRGEHAYDPKYLFAMNLFSDHREELHSVRLGPPPLSEHERR